MYCILPLEIHRLHATPHCHHWSGPLEILSRRYVDSLNEWIKDCTNPQDFFRLYIKARRVQRLEADRLSAISLVNVLTQSSWHNDFWVILHDS